MEFQMKRMPKAKGATTVQKHQVKIKNCEQFSLAGQWGL